MQALAGGLNIALALCYLAIGSLIAIDLERDMRHRGWSHFGVAWLTVMFTCGGHHLVHGVHLAAEGRGIGILEILALAIGLPAGAIFTWLRIEALRGGRGDRLIRDTPAWLQGVTWLYGALALVVVGAGMVLIATEAGYDDPRLLPNVLVAVLYLAIGWLLWRGQHRIRTTFGGWSLSGLSLMLIFPSCALMHFVYVVYAATATFSPDAHGLWVDWLSVPAAGYFVWVLHGLETGTVSDWNDRFEAIDDLAPAGGLPAEGMVPVPMTGSESTAFPPVAEGRS